MIRLQLKYGSLTLADLLKLRGIYGGRLVRDALGGLWLRGAVMDGRPVDLGPGAA